jgi:predicted permease
MMLSSLRSRASRIHSLFSRRAADDDFARELDSHLALLTDENIRRGMSPDEARRAARLRLGGSAQLHETNRELRGFPVLESFAQDVRYALRMLRKSPGFTAVAVLTLALGIGANTAIFTVLDGVMLRSLPVKDPQHLVLFTWTARVKPSFDGHSDYGDCDYEESERDCSFSVPLFKIMSARAGAFSDVTAFAGPLDMDISGNGTANIARGTFVSGDFFSTLGVDAVIGRPLVPSDDSPSASGAIVLTYAYWQRAFGADRSVLGRTVRLDNVPFAIIGVADPRFTGLTPGKLQDFFIPLSFADRVRGEWWGNNENRVTEADAWWVALIGRLKPGVSLAQAQTNATDIFRSEMIHGATPFSKESDDPAISLLPASAGLNGERTEFTLVLYLLMAAVALILLIACANVAGLMLARSATRQKEMAVRLALGAGRSRLIRQLLTEGVLLSLIGGALGIFVGVWGVRAITALLSSGWGAQPFPFVVAPDCRVLAFTVAVTFATGILFGLAPALRSTRVDLTPSLKQGPTSLPSIATQLHSRRLLRLGDSLVIAQVALSMIVLVGAGLLVRTLRNLHHLNPGFDTRNILLFGVDPHLAGYSDEKTAQIYSSLQQRFAALPGVITVSYSEDSLVSGGWSANNFHLDGAPPKEKINSATLRVGLDFFSTMRIPLFAGRAFSPADFAVAAADNAAQKDLSAAAATPNPSAPSASASAVSALYRAYDRSAPVPVIVNEMFAQKFFPGQDPVGKHIGDAHSTDDEVQHPGPGYIIVGVAGDTKYRDLRRAILPTLYRPLIGNIAHFELRTAAEPTALVETVRDIVSRTGDDLPLFGVRTQAEQIEESLYQERLMSRLSSFFALLAVVLACIGLYGLLAYEVARRTRELGIRLALGARPRDILRLTLGNGFVLVAVGCVLGTFASFWLTRFLSTLLFDVDPVDPLTFFGVSLLLALVALAACYIPARRASRVDPLVALRYE